MAIGGRLKSCLQAAKVRYTVERHPVVYTAQEIAAAQHVSGRYFAKSVLVNTNTGPVLAVLPASHLIDFKRLKALLKASKVSIASESDVKRCFPDVEVGAMSPFGTLYNIPVVVDQALSDSEEIVFNAGTHTETVTMRYRDFAALVKPKAGAFGQQAGGPKAKPAAKKHAVKAKTAARKKASPARRRSADRRKRR